MTLDELVPAIVLGDAQAFAQWMVSAEPAVRESLASFARVVDVEAVVQEALLRVWQVAPRFTDDGRPHGLLRLGVRIAKNLAIDEVRRARGRAAEADELERRLADAAPEPAAPPDPFLRARIVDCREALPNKPALALSARLESEGGVPDATLAERLGMKKNTFLQNFTRARKLLKACLERQGIDLQGALS